MIISRIDTDNFFYFSLHAEEVISSSYLNDDNQGIFISSLQFETVNRIFQHIKSQNLDKGKPIILDFQYLEYTQANILDKIIEIRDLGYKLIFKNITNKIYVSLSLKTIENPNNLKGENDNFNTFYFFADEFHDIYKIEINNRRLFSESFKERIKNAKYIKKYEKPHSSSFVYLRSFIDLKRFISEENPFIYFAIYRLAIKIKEKWSDRLNEEPILVGQSLTSTFILSILSRLLKLNILVFDKIGPITKLYSKLEKHDFQNKKYIIVSDFVCLGTEVKIVKSLIEFSGGKYLGNVSLVKVETLTREDLQFDNIDRTVAIFSINNKNNVELNYEIYTNLKSLNG